MKRGMKLMSRMMIAAIVLMAGMIPPHTGARTPTKNIPAIEQREQTAARDTRLRKLHLVRPDLIPYPIHYDVYC